MRGRAPRQAEVSSERRRRRDTVGQQARDFNLWVDESKLDHANYAYRWANEHSRRITRLHGEDWDPVPEEDMGHEVRRHAEIAGDAMLVREQRKAILLRKPRDWYNKDKAEAEERRKQQIGGRLDGDPAATQVPMGYAPKMQNDVTFERGRNPDDDHA